MPFFEKILKSSFIGKQLTRFKLGMSYYTLLMSTISAAMLFKQTYGFVELEIIIAIIPFLILFTILIGYILDKSNINSQESLKANEMTHRFLLTSDLKGQAFQLMQTKALIKALEDMKNGKSLNLENIDSEYKKYMKQWMSPDKKILNN